MATCCSCCGTHVGGCISHCRHAAAPVPMGSGVRSGDAGEISGRGSMSGVVGLSAINTSLPVTSAYCLVVQLQAHVYSPPPPPDRGLKTKWAVARCRLSSLFSSCHFNIYSTHTHLATQHGRTQGGPRPPPEARRQTGEARRSGMSTPARARFTNTASRSKPSPPPSNRRHPPSPPRHPCAASTTSHADHQAPRARGLFRAAHQAAA